MMPSGNKMLSELVLIQIFGAIWHHRVFLQFVAITCYIETKLCLFQLQTPIKEALSCSFNMAYIPIPLPQGCGLQTLIRDRGLLEGLSLYGNIFHFHDISPKTLSIDPPLCHDMGCILMKCGVGVAKPPVTYCISIWYLTGVATADLKAIIVWSL